MTLPSLLVIDPSDPVRKLVALMAREMVGQVREARSAAEALEMLRSGVELVITETHLPDGSGADVLKVLRESGSEAVTLALTAEDDVAEAMNLVRRGAFSVLTKPLTRDAVRDMLQRALDQHHILAQNRNARLLEKRYAEDLEMQVTEQTRFIRSLLDFSNQLNALSDVEAAVELVMNTLQTMVGCRRISILLQTPETGQFAVVKSVGLPTTVRRQPIDLADSPVVRQVQGLGEIVYVADVQSSELARGRGEGKSFMSVPLAVAGRGGRKEVFGIVNLTDREGNGPFSETERQLVQSIADAASIACANLRNKTSLEKSYFDTVGALAMALEAKDPYTHGHSQRVTSMCMIVADVMGFSNEEMDQIMFAGMLHDVGKIGIPESILLKPGRLTAEEFERIREHPAVGEHMVHHISFLSEAAKYIRHHHERCDGKGYPDGLRGEEIELPARIMAIADSYDAMTTDRSYRRRLTSYQVYDELMKGRGTQFDPECLDIFIKHVAESRNIPDYAS